MSAEFQPEAAYGEALAVSKATAAAGHFEAAYHSLMAALHLAEDLADTARLAEVVAVARAHHDVVDAATPPHRLSTQRSHAGRSVFKRAASEAETHLRGLETKRRIAEHRLTP
jgi:hypothetical protein